MSIQGKTNYVTQQQLKTIRGGRGIGHIHSNKDTLDQIAPEKIEQWDSTADKAHTHDNRSAIDLFTYDPETNTVYLGDSDNRVNFAAFGDSAAGGKGSSPTPTPGGGGIDRIVFGTKTYQADEGSTQIDIPLTGSDGIKNVLGITALESAILSAGKVDDVYVNGTSVLDTDKIARIDLTPITARLGDTTAQNPAADKAFVNSSIATATAEFRGTSESGLTEAQFLAWANSLTHNNNDYVFWNTVDSAGNTLYKRYKFNGAAWAFEYTLNNSSYTASQWGSINSGITSAIVNVVKNITNSKISNWDDAHNKAHTHDNRSAIDLFTYDPETNTVYLGDSDNRVNFAAFGDSAAGGKGSSPTPTPGGGGIDRIVFGTKTYQADEGSTQIDIPLTGSDGIKNVLGITALESAILSAGKVDDVYVNGTSVLGTDKIARVDLALVENAIRSLQSQINSVASNIHTDEMNIVNLSADTIVVSSVYGRLYGTADYALSAPASDVSSWAKADTKPSYSYGDGYLSGFGSLATKSSLAASDIPTLAIAKIDGLQTALDGKQPNISDLATIRSNASNGNAAYDGLTMVSQALQSLQSQVLSSVSREASEFEILEAVVSESLHALQAQIDSIATRVDHNELVSNSLHADSISARVASFSGNVLAYGDVAAGSDIRWKKNIKPISDSIIDLLKPCEWDWKEDHGQGHSAGLIAQEVIEVLPFAVKGDEASGLTLNYNAFHAYEIYELQQLRRRVAKLEWLSNI